MTIQAFYNALDARIPASLSCPWDNDGLSVCPDPNAPVTGIVVALDLTDTVIRKAEETGSNVILTHHPLLFHSMEAVVSTPADPRADKVISLIQKGISAMAFHTRLDTVEGGVNDTLADLLGLQDISPFGDNDNPQGAPMGRMGTLPSPMALKDFVGLVKARLKAPCVTFTGGKTSISRVAVLGGSGGDELYTAMALGADALVTGEAKHHQLCDAQDLRFPLIVAGHYATEYPVCAVLAMMASEVFSLSGEEIPVCLMSNPLAEAI